MNKTTQISVEEAFKQAVYHLNSEQYIEAERVCNAIIQSFPNHADAINILGIIAQKYNRHDIAVEQFRRAININSGIALFYFNLATSLYPQGQRQEAIKVLKKALTIDGSNKKFQNYLDDILRSASSINNDADFKRAKDIFNRGVHLQQNGKLEEAVEQYKKCLSMQPDHEGVLSNLALALQQQGKLQEALIYSQKAIEINPEHATTHYNHAIIRQELGELDGAIEGLQKAISIEPNNSNAHYNLGVIFNEKGDYDTAIACYKSAIEAQPSFVTAHFNLGVIFQHLDKLSEAILSYQNALEHQPDNVSILYNLGIVLQANGELEKAVASYQKAISIKPDYVEAFSNLGFAKQEQGKLDEAASDLKIAIKLNPNYHGAHYNLGVTLQEQGKFSEALVSFKNTLAIKPDYVDAHYNVGCVLQEMGKFAEACVHYQAALDLKPDYVKANDQLIFCTDLYTEAKTDLFQSQRIKWNLRHAEPLRDSWSSFSNAPDPLRQLRVGYVGADFLHHSAAHIFGPMLLNYNQENFKIFCYAGNDKEDDLTHQFREKATGWFNTINVDDDQLAAKIREDAIDILVDLAGHTKGNRLLTFARKPAPIQITAWGYPHGTNMAAMDYLFADKFFIPPQDRGKYTEKIIDLPCVIHLKPDSAFIDVTNPPIIKNGYITFGAFNRIEKNNSEVYEMWAQILHKIPTAKLLIKTGKLDSAKRKSDIYNFFQTQRISKDRLILIGRTTREEHIKAHQMIDIMLDPFPNNSGMTSLESLRMGVPVLSCENLIRCPASSSMLHILGLDEWRAKDKQEYVANAIKFAGDINMLKKLRMELRDRFDKSVLGNSQLYVAKVEAIYRQLWQKWCS
ncbi:MAG: tetratricopeptide repeat protein [Magnetococcales bacterium]|nr:tetratricopeptide repeat protein [Magnetococcales bacterium]